jgi:ATP-dependent DNA helicase RecQ
VHSAVSRLEPGDRLDLFAEGDRLELWDLSGRRVGRLAKKCRLMDGYRAVDVRVSAITVRRKDANPEFAEMARTDRWEVVVPELVFEPE